MEAPQAQQAEAAVEKMLAAGIDKAEIEALAKRVAIALGWSFVEVLDEGMNGAAEMSYPVGPWPSTVREKG